MYTVLRTSDSSVLITNPTFKCVNLEKKSPNIEWHFAKLLEL